MRLPGIHEVYDVIDKMIHPFILPDILVELSKPEWTYWEEVKMKNLIKKALSQQMKYGTIRRTGDVIPSGFGNSYFVYVKVES